MPPQQLLFTFQNFRAMFCFLRGFVTVRGHNIQRAVHIKVPGCLSQFPLQMSMALEPMGISGIANR